MKKAEMPNKIALSLAFISPCCIKTPGLNMWDMLPFLLCFPQTSVTSFFFPLKWDNCAGDGLSGKGTLMTAKRSGTKSLLKKYFFSLKKEKAQNTPGGWGGTVLWPGDALCGRVVQGGTLLAIQARNEGITNRANVREKTRDFVKIKHFWRSILN